MCKVLREAGFFGAICLHFEGCFGVITYEVTSSLLREAKRGMFVTGTSREKMLYQVSFAQQKVAMNMICITCVEPMGEMNQ